MFNNLVQAEPVEEEKKAAEPAKKEDFYGAPEKVQDLMPQRYQARANSNMVNGVNVRRTSFYSQKEPSFVQLEWDKPNNMTSMAQPKRSKTLCQEDMRDLLTQTTLTESTSREPPTTPNSKMILTLKLVT
jgi:hypothetical protein